MGDPLGLRAQKEILEHLVSLELQENKGQEGSKESLVTLENMEKKVTEEFREIQGHLVNLVFKAHLVNLECLDHLVNKEMPDNLESKEILDLLDLLVFKVLLVTRVLLDLRDHQD